MGAALGHAAGIEHDDLVGMDDGGEPVGDDDGGAVLGDAVQRALDVALGMAVEGGGGLVQDQDGRGLEDGAGDGDALLLAAGEFQAALADFGLVALRERGD